MAVGMFGFISLTFSTGLFAGGAILGLPPGERDALLVQCASEDVVFYAEWAERGPGKPGAPGIDGLAADPEVLAFLRDVEKALVASLEEETSNGPEEARIMGKTMPGLVKTLLNRSGCLYVSVDADAIATATQQGVIPGPFGQMLAVLSGVKATLIVNGAKDADKLAETLKEMLKLLPEQPPEDLKNVKFPLPPGMSLTLHREGKRFILGFGEGTVEAAVAGLNGKAQGLKQNSRFTASMKRVTIGKMSGISWLDLKAVVEKLTKALGPAGALVQKTVADAGIDKIDSVASYRGVVNGQIHNRTFIKTDGTLDGLLALAAGRTIKPDDFRHVPADCDFVYSLSLNLPKLLATSKEIVAKAHPPSQQMFEQILKQLETELELSIEEDFFKAFGDVWTISNSKAAGGLFVTSLVGTLEVRDSKKAHKVFTQAMEILRDSLPGETDSGYRHRGIYLVNKKFMGNTIYFVNTIGDDVPFAPAFCLTEKHLLIGPHPQAIKSRLRFLSSKEASFTTKIKDLTSHTEGELLSVSYFDTKSLVRYLYAFAPYFGQVLYSEIQSHGSRIDLFSLPSPRAILPYVGNSVSTVTRTKDGIMFDGQTALPVPFFSLAMANMPMLLFAVRMQRFGELERPGVPHAAVLAPAVREKSVKKPAVNAAGVKKQKQARPATRQRKKRSVQTAT
ncbi:MAG: hypothetical protein IID46_01700 [Planctomycetes bacterium]|nr:hypothetical protein [Planctomycetota bacterium]